MADFSNLSPIVRRRGLSSLILATRFLPAFSSSSAAFLALLLLTSKALAQTGTVPSGGSDRTVGQNASFLSKLSDIFLICGRGYTLLFIFGKLFVNRDTKIKLVKLWKRFPPDDLF